MGDADNLSITIDREACIGCGTCASDAPETFEMDDDDIAIVKAVIGDDRETVLDAAENCATDAIKVVNAETGEVLCPGG